MLSEKNYLSILKESKSFEKNKSVSERYLEDIQSEAILPHVTADMIGGRLIVSLSKGAQGAVGAIALMGAFAAAMSLIAMSYQFYKDIISKYGRKCSDFKLGSTGRKRCELRVKGKALEGRAKLLARSVDQCKKTKDPQKCANKIKQKVNELKIKASETGTKLKGIEPKYEGQ